MLNVVDLKLYNIFINEDIISSLNNNENIKRLEIVLDHGSKYIEKLFKTFENTNRLEFLSLKWYANTLDDNSIILNFLKHQNSITDLEFSFNFEEDVCSLVRVINISLVRYFL
jgi:hypothetical protein